MIPWWETSSPNEYSALVFIAAFWFLISLCLVCAAVTMYYDAHPEKTLSRYGDWPVRAKMVIFAVFLTSILTLGFSVHLATSSNLHLDGGEPWNHTYGGVYKTCSEEGKPIADCRKVAKDTANHYRDKEDQSNVSQKESTPTSVRSAGGK